MRAKSLFYKTQEDEYQSLARDAAELYLLRKNTEQIKLHSSQLTKFIIISSLVVVSFIIYFFF